MLRKLIYRLKTDILRAKWLKELELKKKFKIIIRFAKRNIKKC
jgi:hypothetical protein